MKGIYNYHRRPTREVKVGEIGIGGGNEIRLQSMTNTSTMDTEGSVAQIKRIVEAGGEIVRLTTQGVRESENLRQIRDMLERDNMYVPLVADVHFNPNAAFRAAETAHKVRINPGNFVDAARTFRKLEFSEEEYKGEINRIRESLIPFLELCRKHHTAVRLGVNHGSLSDRIMSRYGDTPAGMVESVMEYLRICKENDFHDNVISIKASNTIVMHETVKLLVEEMDKEDMDYPLHLGVTEAGDGEDGRIKSAVGIGALLAEGIGDTIRVSLSEAPENEIPVAKFLRDYIKERENSAHIQEPDDIREGNSRDYADCRRKEFTSGHADSEIVGAGEYKLASDPIGELDSLGESIGLWISLHSHHPNPVGEMAAWIDRYIAAGGHRPIMLCLEYTDKDKETLMLKAAADAGALLLNGYGNGLCIDCDGQSASDLAKIELDILQAARLRVSKTEYIACPGCGRTLFNLQETLGKVKEATKEFVGLKIGVMGCIVNGPGEMADADYGLVGAGVGKVSLYRGKTLVEKNIPQEQGISRLVDIIRSDVDH